MRKSKERIKIESELKKVNEQIYDAKKCSFRLEMKREIYENLLINEEEK